MARYKLYVEQTVTHSYEVTVDEAAITAACVAQGVFPPDSTQSMDAFLAKLPGNYSGELVLAHLALDHEAVDSGESWDLSDWKDDE